MYLKINPNRWVFTIIQLTNYVNMVFPKSVTSPDVYAFRIILRYYIQFYST